MSSSDGKTLDFEFDEDIEIKDIGKSKSVSDIDSDIDKLAAELGIELETVSTSADAKGSFNGADVDDTESDVESLIDTEKLDVISQGSLFSECGELVLMDKSDNEDGFRLIYLDVDCIAVVKRIRLSSSVEDLTRSIKSTGLLKPLDVAPTSATGVYVLLDGYRRILACAKAGMRRIPCVVNMKISVPDIPILEAMYNHSKRYTVREMVEYIDYLEKEKGILSASMIEYLLQMNSGDYTKLKDLLNDGDEDILPKLFDGTYTIDMAFRKLEQRRKKESQEEKDNKKAAKVYDDAAESGAEAIADSGEIGDESIALTDEEISALAINPRQLDDGLDDKTIEEMVDEGNSIDGYKPNKQDPNDRTILDPALRKAVLARDDCTCQICKVISGQEYTEVLDVHHIQEVYLGGSDDIDNLIVACTVCHKLIHLWGRGDLHIRPLDELDESEQAKFKRVVKLGNVIRKGMALRGIKKDEMKKKDKADTIGRTRPGTPQIAG